MTQEGVSEDTWCLFPVRLFTDYRTPHFVIIRSKWLRIPELCLKGILLLIFMSYIVIPLHFMRKDPVTQSRTLDLEPPISDWWNSDCTWLKGDCEIVVPNETECDKNFSSCLPAPLHESAISPKGGAVQGGSVSVAFSEFRTVEACAKSEISRCTSFKKGHAENRSFSGVDTLLLFVRHRFETATWTQSGAEVQGLLEFADGSEPRRLRDKVSNSAVISDEAFLAQRFPDFCGSDNGNGSDTCMSTQAGDYMSIGLLLKAANMSIDTIRVHGGAMELGLTFTNMDMSDFWSYPIGPKAKYVYRPREQLLGFNEGSQDIFWTELEDITETSQRKVVKPCLLIAVNFKGERGVFDWLTLMTRLTVCSAALALSHFVVDNILVTLYKRSESMKHVHALFEVYKQKESPEDETFFEEWKSKQGESPECEMVGPRATLRTTLRQTYGSDDPSLLSRAV